MKWSLGAVAMIAGLLVSLITSTNAEVAISGSAQYRLRVNLNNRKDADGQEIEDQSKTEYQHKHYWNLGVVAKPKDNLEIAIRLMENRDEIDNSLMWNSAVNKFIGVKEASFKVSIGKADFSAGILKQDRNATLDLLVFEEDGYAEVVSSTWADETYGALAGNRFGFNLVKRDNIAFGIKLTNSIYSDKVNAEEGWYNKTAFLHIVEIPVKAGIVKLNPHMYLHRNKNFAAVREHGVDPVYSIGAGVNFGIKPVSALDIRGAFAVATYDYSEAHAGNDELTQEAPIGIVYGFETRVKPPFGQARLGFTMNMNHDREDESDNGNPVKYSGLCIDGRYSIPVKNISIVPRVRYWLYTNSVDESAKSRIRPELIFSAKF